MRTTALGLALLLLPPVMPAQTLTRLARPDGATAWSVQVPDTALVFTGQVCASRPGAAVQAEVGEALQELERVLRAAGGDLGRVARLNAYVTDDGDIPAVRAGVAERFTAAPPAFTLVRTPLVAAGARVAFEAVGPAAGPGEAVRIVNAQAAVSPAGGKVFISGQAERGADAAEAVRLTMAGLQRTLSHLGLKATDVVQVKAFLTPFAEHAAARREIAASFQGVPPPVVLIEWVSTLPVEIELVVSARALAVPPGDKVAYLPLPWLTPSPRYSKVVHVGPGVPLIFIGALDGDGRDGAREQMKAIFERLGSVLFDAGSSYRNLIKATYYLGDSAARTALGDIRGVYFDPTRAPAASALEVKSLGRGGRTAQIDMIAFPIK